MKWYPTTISEESNGEHDIGGDPNFCKLATSSCRRGMASDRCATVVVFESDPLQRGSVGSDGCQECSRRHMRVSDREWAKRWQDEVGFAIVEPLPNMTWKAVVDSVSHRGQRQRRKKGVGTYWRNGFYWKEPKLARVWSGVRGLSKTKAWLEKRKRMEVEQRRMEKGLHTSLCWLMKSLTVVLQRVNWKREWCLWCV